ncbi:Helix-hairpin-helix motif containing protein [Sedimentisphaera cyanobacteriorum]|uniref:Helix-hairpin-helix motif containing protein n=2 Tax=Sedimentisphaera cyanobacteriorum TaxID=1940790 RepID=A0A1Q2HQ47_9BACT|nr:Helix-hairpin-helix motif containing protein [Sedimentisphaera cyanobacteriorum]
MKSLKQNSKASAMIIVLVLMAVLAAVGLTMLSVARISNLKLTAEKKDAYTETASGVVVELIADEIAKDCSASSEPFDYPGPADPWLASLEPYYSGEDLNNGGGVVKYQNETGRDVVKWLQISKPSFADFGAESQNDMNVDPPGTMKNIPDYQEFYKFIDDKDEDDELTAEDIKGLPADADGDGVVDARWFEVPDMKTPAGQSYFAAVRIIDNSAMVNVNTAYFNDIEQNSGNEEYKYSGESPLCVGMNFLLNTNNNKYGGPFWYAPVIPEADNIDDFHNSRCRPGVQDDWFSYTENAALRIENTSSEGLSYYRPYSLDDEFELRHRFCINSSFTSRLESLLPATVGADEDDPANDSYWGDMYKMYGADTRVSNVDALESWYIGIFGGGEIDEKTVNPERRHLFTAMSKSRQITPDLGVKAFPEEITGEEGVADYEFAEIREAVFSVLNDSPHEEFGAGYSAGRLSTQFALNLLDWQDSDSEGSDHYDSDSNILYYGYDGAEELKDITLHCSAIGIYDHTDPQNLGTVPTGTYYLLEFFREGGMTVASSNEYEIHIVRDGFVVNEFNLSDVVDDDIPADGFAAVTNLADQQDAEEIFKDSFDYYSYPSLSLQNGDIVKIYKKDYPASGDTLLVDWAEVKLNTPVAPDEEKFQKKQGQLVDEDGDNTGLLLPDSFVNVNAFILIGQDITGELNNIQMQLKPSNEPIFSPAQIVMAPAVCSFTDQDDPNDSQTFAGAVQTHQQRAGSLGADGISIFDSFGRFDLADHRYADLANVFTVMTTLKDGEDYYETAPAYDGINNDGARLTTDDPLGDGIDNNGDGDIDNQDEDSARYRETVSYGLININTAPKAVLMTLPWVDEELAEAIIAYRDMTGVGVGESEQPDYSAGNTARRDDRAAEKGFSSIYELINVTNDSGLADYDFQQLAKDGQKLSDSENSHIDLTEGSVMDDFEERNIILERLANLTTVRSDVFTAYILVREGVSGVQKRKVCIIDRSNVWESSDKPEIFIKDVEE